MFGPYLQRWLVRPLVARLPATLAANSLTLFANACSLVAIVAVLAGGARPWSLIVGAIGVFIYVVVDNADGVHARRTGRSSPFGEFLDHWLDTFNGAYLSLGASVALALSLDHALLLLAGTQVSFFAAMWEQRLTGRLVIGRFNQIEACVMLCLVDVVDAVVGRQWTHAPIVFGLSVADAFIVVQVTTFVAVIAGALYRSIRVASSRAFASLAGAASLAGGCVLWASMGVIDPRLLIVLLTLLGPATSGHLVVSRLLASETPIVIAPFAFALVAAGVVAASLRSASYETYIAIAFAAYLAGCIFRDARSAVRALRRYLRSDEILGRLFAPP